MTQLLAIDIGAGTQDILLLDTRSTIENCVKLILPSPTTLIAHRIEKATKAREPVVITGTNMGGGPSGSAMRKHLKAGLPVFATPEAATTFNDDLNVVAGWGVTLIAEDEVKNIKKAELIETRDLDLPKIQKIFKTAGVQADLDGVAVAVLDHGAAPPGVSDRLFRFQNLRRSVETGNSLYNFAYLAQEVPSYLTRMSSVVKSFTIDKPLLLLDTGPAAALGALEDAKVRAQDRTMVVNVGNLHTLAFHLRKDKILALFEHHTGILTTSKLDRYVHRLCLGELTQEEVYSDGGHGSFIVEKGEMPFITVTGPRRLLMYESSLKPHFAVPHGDMMLSGCFGLIAAMIFKKPEWREEVEIILRNQPG